MEQNCPHCGAEDREGTAVCRACGGKLAARGNVRRARSYDGYAVGRRVLGIAPAWLLGLIAAVTLLLLAFGWAARRAGEEADAFRNEATNSSASPEANARAGAAERRAERTPPAPAAPTAATPAASPQAVAQAGPGEGEAFSVQTGAFAELSQANEQVSRLRAAGFEARVTESEATRFRFQVRSGVYATREEAAALATRLRAAGVAGQTVIIEPEKK